MTALSCFLGKRRSAIETQTKICYNSKKAPLAQREAGESMNSKSDYIAVFDSGVGGISVLRQLRAQMPNERFLYFGDSANAPYGTRTAQEIRRLVMAVSTDLMGRGCKALVVACNTATAAAIDLLRQTWPDRIIVGIEPALKPAAEHFPGGCVGVLATPVTLREEKFQHLTQLCRDKCQIVQIPAPGLVELVEQGKAVSPEAEELLRPLLEPLKGKLQALVLGCTHYPFAARSIRAILGDSVALLDGGEGTARETRRRLEQAGLLWDGPGQIRFESSLPGDGILSLSRTLLEQE